MMLLSRYVLPVSLGGLNSIYYTCTVLCIACTLGDVSVIMSLLMVIINNNNNIALKMF